MATKNHRDLIGKVAGSDVDRRLFVKGAVAAGTVPAVAAGMAQRAAAHQASPAASPVGTGEVIKSISRAEYEDAGASTHSNGKSQRRRAAS